MNLEKKNIYQYKINSYKQNYKITDNIKLLEKIYKYKKKINLEGGGRFKNLSPELRKIKIKKLKKIFESIYGEFRILILFGRYLALTLKKNIIEDEEKLNSLGSYITNIINIILNSLDDDGNLKALDLRKELRDLFILLNDQQQIIETEFLNFTQHLEAEIKDILLNLDDDKDVETVILPTIGIELGLLLVRRMPTRFVDPCILIGKFFLQNEPLEIQREFGCFIVAESEFLNSIVNDQIADSLPFQLVCNFGNRLFKFFTEKLTKPFELELKENIVDNAFGTFGMQAINFLRPFSPQVEDFLQIDRIGSEFFNFIRENFKSLDAFKKGKTKVVIPELSSRTFEVFNVNDDVAKIPRLVCSRLIQKIVEDNTMPQTFVFLDCSNSQRGFTRTTLTYDDEVNPVLIFIRTLLEKQDVFFHKFGGIPEDTPPS